MRNPPIYIGGGGEEARAMEWVMTEEQPDANSERLASINNEMRRAYPVSVLVITILTVQGQR